MRTPALTAEQRSIARRLIGKCVKAVRLRPFHRGPDRDAWPATDPEIVFTDGSTLRFSAQETDGNDYGIALILSKEES